MNYTPIQASAVPCERVFSSSSETHTKKRNHISPVLMEVLQMVKFFLKKEHLNFTKGWAASQWDMEQCMVYDRSSYEHLTPSANANDTLLRAIAEDECDNIEDTATIYDK